MSSQYESSGVVDGTYYVLDQLLAADGLKFSHHYYDDGSFTGVLQALPANVPINLRTPLKREEHVTVFHSEGK